MYLQKNGTIKLHLSERLITRKITFPIKPSSKLQSEVYIKRKKALARLDLKFILGR